jgi:hypothetical protein
LTGPCAADLTAVACHNYSLKPSVCAHTAGLSAMSEAAACMSAISLDLAKQLARCAPQRNTPPLPQPGAPLRVQPRRRRLSAQAQALHEASRQAAGGSKRREVADTAVQVDTTARFPLQRSELRGASSC